MRGSIGGMEWAPACAVLQLQSFKPLERKGTGSDIAMVSERTWFSEPY